MFIPSESEASTHNLNCLREAAKNNSIFLMARPLRGGGGKGLATKKR